MIYFYHWSRSLSKHQCPQKLCFDPLKCKDSILCHCKQISLDSNWTLEGIIQDYQKVHWTIFWQFVVMKWWIKKIIYLYFALHVSSPHFRGSALFFSQDSCRLKNLQEGRKMPSIWPQPRVDFSGSTHHICYEQKTQNYMFTPSIFYLFFTLQIVSLCLLCVYSADQVSLSPLANSHTLLMNSIVWSARL